MPEGACKTSTRKGGRAAAPRPSSVSSLGGLGSPMASDPLSGSCTSMNTVCSDSDRPASLSSSASSASLQDHQTIFGSNGGLGGCPTASCPHQSGSDISLDLTPVALLDGAGEAPGSARWPHGWSPGPARARERRAERSHLDRVVQEIVETEQAYVRDLRSIVEDYLGCIINCRKLPLKPEQVGALFCNIEDIYEFNSELLEDMRRDPCAHAVAECFVQRSEEFDIYTLYCMNYPNSVSVLRECMEDEALASFFRERQATLSHFLPLETYLLKPVQRILKYHLLLQELVKHYEKSSPGYDTVEEASITMTAVAWYINDMKRKQEHATRLQEIQRLLEGWNGPELGAFGELILEGQFRAPRVRKERVFFLLSKVLLIAKRRSEAFVYKSHIFCCNLALQENGKDPISFKISDLSIPKHQHVVQVRNQEEKRLWIHYLKRLIVENHPASIPQKARQVLLENSFQGPPDVLLSTESPKKPLPSPWLEEAQACARNRRQSEPPQYMYSPERARRSCPILGLEKSGSCRRDRRQSEPAKESPSVFHPARTFPDAAKLKQVGSDCDLSAPAECPLPPGMPSASPAAGRAEPGAEEPGQEEGGGEFLLPEEATPSSLSITEEILELLSQRGLNSDAGKEGGCPTAVSPALQDQPLQSGALGELEEEEEEGECQEDPSLGVTHQPLPSGPATFQAASPPRRPPSLASDSLAEEEEQLLPQRGSGSPPPHHLPEALAPVETSRRAEDSAGAVPEAPNQEDQPSKDADGCGSPSAAPQSSSAPMGRDEGLGAKAEEGGAERDPSLARSNWLLIEKIKTCYEGAEPACKVPGPGKKDWGPPVPPGVVRESVLHFNSLWRQAEVQEGELGGARLGKPLPQPGSRSRSRSSHAQGASCQEGGRGLLPTSPDPSKRGRSCSEGSQSPEGTGQPSCDIGQMSSTSGGDAHHGQSRSGDEASSTAQPLSGKGGRSPLGASGRGSRLEEDSPAGPEFRSCAEIRRAWQEKERGTVDTPKKGSGSGGQATRGPCFSLETPIYAEPLCIVEDSDLEDGPYEPNGNAGGTAWDRWGAEVGAAATATATGPLPPLGLYESEGGPCLLETSERILSKVQALAQMYSEKILFLKAQKRGPERGLGTRPRGPRRRAPSRSLPGVQEATPGSSFPHCEPRIYGHILIQEPLHHVVGVQENTPLAVATWGTAFDLRSERPPPLLSPDLLGPLRQDLPCPPCVPPGAPLPSAPALEPRVAHRGRDVAGSPAGPRSPKHQVAPPTSGAPSKDGAPPSLPGGAAEATLGAPEAEGTAWTRLSGKERRQAGQLCCGSGTQPEVSEATGPSHLSLEPLRSRLCHEATSSLGGSGPAEEAKDWPPGASATPSRLQKQEEPTSLPNSSSPWQVPSPLGRTDTLKLAGWGRKEVRVPVPNPEASQGEPGAHRGEALHPAPPLGAAAAPPPASSSPGNPMVPSLPRAGTRARESPPGWRAEEASESPGSVQGEPCQAGPLPDPLPSSPVRRCLSSSAAAISRYLAASCISQSLAKRNGGPAPEETHATPQPSPPSGALRGALVDPLALLPKGAPSRGGRLGPSLPRETSQPSGGSGPPSPTRHRALLATVQAFEPRAHFTSLSEPSSRAQSPSALKPRVCSPPPPPRAPASSIAPFCPHPPRPLTGPILSPVALRPGSAGRVLDSLSQVGSPAPDGGLAESPATNGDCAGRGPGPSQSHSGPQDQGGPRWPNVPGLCLNYMSGGSRLSPPRRPPLDGEGHPSPEAPLRGGDVAGPTDRSHQRASYSTTVNIQIRGSGRMTSFSKAQVSLTHPLLATRKVNSSATETPPNP